ncbi:hypothetical protein BSLG_008161 [Batrachochytrium salamandrivorans]|nr:hypothetical protein BSLG_008161 [Batrachochytrium salamandrivorans]
MQSLDQDLADKARSKYDPAAELDAQHYLEEVAQVRFDPNLSFADNLRNGVILCKAINAIMPNDPIKQKISESRLPFKQMENIHLYLEKTKQLGMPSFESFQTVDLFEAKNINQVINSIFSLSRQAAKYGYTQVPTLGPQLAQKTERQFTESQLAEGRAAVPLLQGFAAPVSQAGMGAMGGSRQVYNPIIGTGDTSVSSSFFAAGEVGRRADLGGAMGSRREIGGVYLDSPLFRGAPLSPLSPMSPSTRTALRSSGGDSDVFCATEELLPI